MTWISDAQLRRLTAVAPIPETIADRYRVKETIGAGGMGVVYLADDLALGREVAVKVIDAELTDSLISEARIVARLEHPGIVPVHDVGALPDGRVFYVMKRIAGRTLADYAADERSLPARLRVFQKVCDAVAFAHSRGVVHRDLTPRNVMIGAFGEAVVLDWGLARADAGEDEGTIFGTPGFMAPEQSGSGGAITERTDVYALGAMLRFLIDDLPRVPRALQSICDKATRELAAERYATVAELGDDVLRFLESAPVSAHRENPFEATRRWLGRHRAIVSIVAAYVIMRVLVMIFLRR